MQKYKMCCPENGMYVLNINIIIIYFIRLNHNFTIGKPDFTNIINLAGMKSLWFDAGLHHV